MNVLIRGIILTAVLVAMVATSAFAIDPPHDATNGVVCANCHYAGSTINTVGFTNFCNTCHSPGGKASLHPFAPNDASNIFGNVTPDGRTGTINQNSHSWGGGLSVPRAGAVDPTAGNTVTTSPLYYAPLTGLNCDRCHALHGTIQSATNGFPFLRMLKDQDQICFECHSPRKTINHTTGSHPVTMNYATAIQKFARYTTLFQTNPVNANPTNPTSAMQFKGGNLLCSTCHGMHYSDSSSKTFDSASSANGLYKFSTTGTGNLDGLVPGDGNLLRTDRRAATANGVNICTNCHKGKYAHNVKGQNIQCADCHGAHVDEGDGSTPNVWLVNRYMVYSTGTGYKLNNRAAGKPTFFTSTSTKNYRAADGVSGVCQACHVIPTTIADHTLPNVNCNTCHYHNNPAGSFAAAGGSCTSCHGQPPVASTTGGPDGAASGYTVNEALTPHGTHAAAGGYGYACLQCHQGNTHNSGSTFQDVFKSPASPTATLAATGGTPTYNGTNLTCATVYCHSNGAPRTVAALSGTAAYPVISPAWSGTKGSFAGTNCVSCHGNSATLATNVHAKHVNPTTGKNYACGACHAATVAFNKYTTILDRTKHVNGVKEVSFDGAAAGTTFNSAVGAATCATSCHSNGKSAAPVVVPSWTSAATGGCGTCHQVTPTIAATVNGSANSAILSTNGHFDHFSSSFGPKLGLTVTACQKCHTYTSELAATHVNGSLNVLGCTPCHQGTAPTWSSNRIASCESCHSTAPAANPSGLLSVITVEAPDKTLSVTKGHTQASYTGTPVCVSCHNANSQHISGVLGDNVRLTLANTNAQCASCHNVPGKTIASFQNMSSHFTSYTTKAQDMLCKTCHDPHGTANRSMVRTKLKGAWANASTYTITYTTRNVGMVDTVTNRGLCQVCHSKTAHYRAGVPETNHPTSGCLDCHRHNGAGGAFKVSGSCDSCHGYPPMPKGLTGLTFGTAGNYQFGKFEDYSGGGGAHSVPAHVKASAVAGEGWANCTMCHAGGTQNTSNHKMLTPVKSNIANVTVMLDQKLRFSNTQQATYANGNLVYPGNSTGTCNNVECHFKPSPRWSIQR